VPARPALRPAQKQAKPSLQILLLMNLVIL